MEEGRILEKGRGRERYISDGRRETGIKGKGGGKDKRNGEGRVEDNRKGGGGGRMICTSCTARPTPFPDVL